MAPAQAPETDTNFRQLLAGIEADLASGKIAAAEALAAKGELAREMLRLKAEPGPGRAQRPFGRLHMLAGTLVIAALSLSLYTFLGRPDLPAQPLDGRADVAAARAAEGMDLDTAIAEIEAALAANPQDLRGWTVIAPAYMEQGRFREAANAYGMVLSLTGPDAEVQTDAAEALLLAADGAGSREAMLALRGAAQLDPTHVRSRLYLGAELTRMGDYAEAARFWQEAIALAEGDEPWLPAARQGLAVAQNDGVDTSADQQAEMIAGMVASLESRLGVDGGSVEDWTQLVRSYLVLGNVEAAQDAYDRAVAAYPAAFDRGAMDTLALEGGLVLKGGEE